MQLFYRLAADGVVILHCVYVSFVIFGQIAILAGWALHWKWTRNITFRVLHLLAIAFVVGEALCGIPCPLTTWEQSLRNLAGDRSYQGDFLANWVHEILFYEGEPWVFTVCYSLFGLLVLLTFLFYPPRRQRRAHDSSGMAAGKTDRDAAESPPQSRSEGLPD